VHTHLYGTVQVCRVVYISEGAFKRHPSPQLVHSPETKTRTAFAMREDLLQGAVV
jgi:hypothetical protein